MTAREELLEIVRAAKTGDELHEIGRAVVGSMIESYAEVFGAPLEVRKRVLASYAEVFDAIHLRTEELDEELDEEVAP